MKNSIYLILFAFLFPVFLHADEQVPVKGDWGDEIIRTLVPKRPIVFINGDVLTIYMEDPLSNLTVTISDSEGNTVYQECISTYQPNDSHAIVLEDKTGVYTITLSHRHGYLSGEF